MKYSHNTCLRPLSLTLICIQLTLLQVQAQNSGDALFENQVVHEINFEFDQSDYWEQMEKNFDETFGQNDQIYIMGHVTIDGELVDSVGVRFKGFTSYPYDSDKKPVKIDFNKYVNSKRYDGLRKLNLNNAFGDPSFQRDVLCYKMLREMGVKAPRTAWAKVSFQGEYWGLYQIIEQVDKEFLGSNFADNDGNLFKNKGWSFLEWLGNTSGPYSQIFDLKTNEAENDWSGFIELMDVINNSSLQEFEEEIESVFNVELFLRTLAVDIATNNWDSFMEHGRNWYMYEDASSGIFNWIPWDYNFALGGSFISTGGEDCFVFPSFIIFTDGSTTVRFQENGFASSNTATVMWDFGDGSPTEEGPEISHTYAAPGSYEVCMEVVLDDCVEITCKEVVTSFDPADCASLSASGHPADDVYDYVISSMPSCCDIWSISCEEFWVFADDLLNGTGVGGNFDLDQSDNERLLIQRLLSIPAYQEFYYNQFCKLTANVMTEENLFAVIDHNVELIDEAVANDPNILYGYDSFMEDSGENGIKKYLTTRIENVNTRLEELHTCAVPEVLAFQEVVVNEFVASNDSIGGGIPDPEGGYPDWIELYNTTDRSVNLSGVFVSDDLDNLTKWEFPSGTLLGSDEYLILWADNDLTQTGYHVAFKLSKGGETIYLSNSDGSIIDSISYGEQKTNIAYARVPNGTGDFQFWTATFSNNNDGGISSTQDNALTTALHVYPNPASDLITVEVDDTHRLHHLEMTDATGRRYDLNSDLGDRPSQAVRVEVSELPAGIYLLTLTAESGATTQQKVIIAR